MRLRRRIIAVEVWRALAAGAGAAVLVLIVGAALGPVSPVLWAAACFAGLAGFAGLMALRRSGVYPDETQQLLWMGETGGALRLGRDGRIRFASEAAAELLGQAAADLRRQSITAFAVGAARAEVQAALARASYFAAATDVTFQLRGGDGARWIEMRCRPLFPNEEGEPAFEIAALVRDVSAQKTREAALEDERARAEAALQAKARFLADMSHELRTPLNAIIGFSEIMTDEMFGPLGNARYADYAMHIRESGEHLRDLINDVLDASKIEAGRFTVELERVSIPKALEEALKIVSVTARKRGVTLDVHFPDGLPRVTADRRAVKQMLLNLLSNAIKFTPEGGTVTAAAHAESGNMILEVRDTGIGISKADLGRLGRPYEQVVRRRGSVPAGEAGTGLGLALVKTFAGLHGGTLDIVSEEGRGTIARVTLPLEGPRQTHSDDEVAPPVDLSSQRPGRKVA